MTTTDKSHALSASQRRATFRFWVSRLDLETLGCPGVYEEAHSAAILDFLYNIHTAQEAYRWAKEDDDANSVYGDWCESAFENPCVALFELGTQYCGMEWVK